MCLSSKCDFCKVNQQGSEELTGKTFVNHLLTKGSQVNCDETNSAFSTEELPSYYDPVKFKRGQDFFHQNIFGMCLGSFLGLLADLSNPTGLAVLVMTEMSGSNHAAYKRYMATIFHMIVWYESDFRPGSTLWRSIKNVKFKHNSASKKAASALNYRITQKDMALAHWGFMGVTVCRPELVGVYETNQEAWRSFIHFWRVIGYLLGIQEEFNICSTESVGKSKAICSEIALKIMVPASSKRQCPYPDMCHYLINGLWPLNPFLEYHSFMFYMDATLRHRKSLISPRNEGYKNLKWDAKLRLQIIVITVDLMRFRLVRAVLNGLQVSALWLSKRLPFLAYWKYGSENAHITAVPSVCLK